MVELTTLPKLILTLSFCGLTMAVQPVWCQRPPTPAQTQQAPATTQAPAAVSVAAYDVASIRISHLTSDNQHVGTANGSLSAENTALKVLIRFAYDLPDRLLVGGP